MQDGSAFPDPVVPPRVRCGLVRCLSVVAAVDVGRS
uniref:Uncharacterized protein n=1 Tax=Anopheles dirus TaxID=7168 RepID=A0A182NW10_9DIPT